MLAGLLARRAAKINLTGLVASASINKIAKQRRRAGFTSAAAEQGISDRFGGD
jgi:hypothetical protein